MTRKKSDPAPWIPPRWVKIFWSHSPKSHQKPGFWVCEIDDSQDNDLGAVVKRANKDWFRTHIIGTGDTPHLAFIQMRENISSTLSLIEELGYQFKEMEESELPF